MRRKGKNLQAFSLGLERLFAFLDFVSFKQFEEKRETDCFGTYLELFLYSPKGFLKRNGTR